MLYYSEPVSQGVGGLDSSDFLAGAPGWKPSLAIQDQQEEDILVKKASDP